MSVTKKLLDAVDNSETIVALTGAGMSVESGIAPFRGKGGLWEKFDPEEYAHVNAFKREPEKSWMLFRLQYNEISKARPNPGHEALVKLEEHGLSAVITQNVDGLHKNKEVVELHGNIQRAYCTGCNMDYNTVDFVGKEKSINCKCGAVVRPDVVLFGEPLSNSVLSRAWELSSRCDLMLVIGTSAVVQPAASLPLVAKNSGSMVVELNLEHTPLTNRIADLSIFKKAGEILPVILDRLRHS